MIVQPKVDLKQVDCRLSVSDSPVGDSPWMIPCPKGGDTTASLAVYPDHLHCFHCGTHIARRIDSLAFLLGCSVPEAIKNAHKYTSAAVDGYRERVAQQVKRDPLPTHLAGSYNALLRTSRASRRPWLHDRGLTNETIEKFVLGHDSTRFTIPVFGPNRELYTIRFRNDPAFGTEDEHGRHLPKYSGMRGRNGLYLYPEWLIKEDGRDYIVVCEGELDAVRLIQEGIPACSPTNGAGNVPKILSFLSYYDRIKAIYIASDMDEPGRAVGRELYNLAFQSRYKVKLLEWDPTWGKDVTDLYRSGHTLGDTGVSKELPSLRTHFSIAR